MAGQTFFGGSLGPGPQHVGRRWSGPDVASWPELADDPCGCDVAACGLTVWGRWAPGCPYHGVTKSIRQSHPADQCPAGVDQ